MMLNRRAAADYGAVMVETGVNQANPTQLIQMLLDGFIESIDVAEGHMRANNIAEKAKSISRASRIVLGLLDALDYEKGGDLARNLSELYSYVTRRLLHINLKNDIEGLHEVRSLMNEVREAWSIIPSKMAAMRVTS